MILYIMKLSNFFFYLSVVVFPFGQLIAYRLPSYPEVRILVLDILVGLTTGFWILSKTYRIFRRSTKISIMNKRGRGIGLFVFTAAVSILVNLGSYGIKEIIAGALYLVRFVIYAGLYFVVQDLRGKPFFNSDLSPLSVGGLRSGDQLRVAPCVLFAGVLSSVFGIIQFFLYPDLRNLKYLGWDPHYGRAFGTFLDPQFLGIILVLTFVLLIGDVREKKTYIVYSFIVFAGIVLTFSRSSYLALAGALFVLGILDKFGNKIKFGILAILSASVLFYMFRPEGVGGNLFRQKSAIARVRNWKEAFKIWKKNPVFGVGFNMYRYNRISVLSLADPLGATTGVVSGSAPDNSFLFVLATTGLVGLAAYLNMWKGFIMNKINKTNIAIITALFIHGFFNNTLFYPHVMWILFLSLQ